MPSTHRPVSLACYAVLGTLLAVRSAATSCSRQSGKGAEDIFKLSGGTISAPAQQVAAGDGTQPWSKRTNGAESKHKGAGSITLWVVVAINLGLKLPELRYHSVQCARSHFRADHPPLPLMLSPYNFSNFGDWSDARRARRLTFCKSYLRLSISVSCVTRAGILATGACSAGICTLQACAPGCAAPCAVNRVCKSDERARSIVCIEHLAQPLPAELHVRRLRPLANDDCRLAARGPKIKNPLTIPVSGCTVRRPSSCPGPSSSCTSL